jgi:hypothetical protein
VYVVEGEEDVAVMETVGLLAVSVSSAAHKNFDSEEITALGQAPRIFLIGDQDKPGQGCMDRLQAALALSEKTFRIRFSDAKDVSELAGKLGADFLKRIVELRDRSLTSSWVRDNLPSISQLSTEPVRWLVHEMFPYGGLSMVSSKAGGKKSLFAMFLAKALAGVMVDDFLGREIPRHIPVLYIDRENPEGMVSERARFMGIVVNRDFMYWGDWTTPTPMPDDPRLMEFVRREKGFVIFDSLQDWYGAGFNENDNTKVIELMGKFRALARAGAGVLLLHHFAKYTDVSRGGTGFVALTDMAFTASKSEADGEVMELRPDRFRMCANWEMDIRFHWSAGERHNYAKFYSMEMLRDEPQSAIAKRAQAEKVEKQANRNAEKTAEKMAKADILERLVTENPGISVLKLHNQTDIRRDDIPGLLALKGWEKTKDGWRQKIVPIDIPLALTDDAL